MAGELHTKAMIMAVAGDDCFTYFWSDLTTHRNHRQLIQTSVLPPVRCQLCHWSDSLMHLSTCCDNRSSKEMCQHLILEEKNQRNDGTSKYACGEECRRKALTKRKAKKWTKRKKNPTKSKAWESRGDDFGPPIWTGRVPALKLKWGFLSALDARVLKLSGGGWGYPSNDSHRCRK